MTETDSAAVFKAARSRYTRLLEFEPDNATQHCPVLAERGGVLLDNQTGQHYLQLKLRNRGGRAIRALRLSVAPIDETGAHMFGPFSVPYSDLSCPPGGDFGAKRLIPLYQPEARRFQVAIEEVTLDDGSVLRFSVPKPPHKKPPAMPPKGPTAAGEELDRVLDMVTPTCIAQRLAKRVPSAEVPARKKTCLTALRVLALCAELCLLLSLVSCNEDLYTGLDLIWQTLSLDFNGFHMWGQAALTVCAVLCMFCLGCSFVRQGSVFRTLLPVGETVAILTVLMFLYYALNPTYTLLFGAYLLTLIYLGLFAVSLYGRAAELAEATHPTPVFSQHLLFGSPTIRRCLFAVQILYWTILYPMLANPDIKPIALPCLWITLAVLVLVELRSRRAVAGCALLLLCDLAAAISTLAYAQSYSHDEVDVFLGLCGLAVAAASPLLLHFKDKRSQEEAK